MKFKSAGRKKSLDHLGAKLMRAAWTQPNPTDGSTQPTDNSGPVYVLDVKRQVGGEDGVFEQTHHVS